MASELIQLVSVAKCPEEKGTEIRQGKGSSWRTTALQERIANPILAMRESCKTLWSKSLKP